MCYTGLSPSDRLVRQALQNDISNVWSDTSGSDFTSYASYDYPGPSTSPSSSSNGTSLASDLKYGSVPQFALSDSMGPASPQTSVEQNTLNTFNLAALNTPGNLCPPPEVQGPCILSALDEARLAAAFSMGYKEVNAANPDTSLGGIATMMGLQDLKKYNYAIDNGYTPDQANAYLDRAMVNGAIFVGTSLAGEGLGWGLKALLPEASWGVQATIGTEARIATMDAVDAAVADTAPRYLAFQGAGGRTLLSGLCGSRFHAQFHGGAAGFKRDC